jgi:NAD(P)-dependent dehydrogenase (short-subunit alcohol dehydrogenase family)
VRRVALVTGASRGIGLEIAKQLAKSSSHDVIIGARNLARAEREAKRISGAKLRSIELDVTSDRSIRELDRTVKSEFGRLDILVNNAAILEDISDLPSETDLEVAKKTLETNLFGPWRLCKTFAPLMKQNNYGRIVNISSSAGTFEKVSENAYAPSYSLSKWSLNCLTLMFARELKGTNVLINAMDPGWVRTDMGGPSAPRNVSEGADTAVWLATLPEGGPSGGFFRDRKKSDW